MESASLWSSPLILTCPDPAPPNVELAAFADSLNDAAALSDKSLSAVLSVELGANEIRSPRTRVSEVDSPLRRALYPCALHVRVAR